MFQKYSVAVIVLHRLVAYFNHDMFLENKIWEKIPCELIVQGREELFLRN